MKLGSLAPIFIASILGSGLGCSGKAPLDGKPPARAVSAVDLGPVAPDTLIDFVVGLAVREPTRLHEFVASRRAVDAPLGPDDFAGTFAVTPAEYARVVNWMSGSGVFITRTTAGRTTVSAYGSASAVEALFGVELHQYSDANGTFFAAASPINIANDLVGTISGVVGLSGSAGWLPHLAWPDLSAGAALAPADMHIIYNSAAIANPGMGETVAILGSGDGPDPVMDLGDFMTQYKPYNLTTVSSYKQVNVGGANRDGAEAQDEAIENVLDAEMVLSMAPMANIVHVLTATNSPGLFTDGISYIVNQLPQAHAATVSYGGCERGAAQEVAVLNTLFEQAQAQGQQWFFASGDTGPDGCRDGAGNMHITAGWPTSSPYVIGVGGTEIGNSGTEIVWNQNRTGSEAAGGGAPSEIFTKPAYQTGKTPNDNARDTPDISAIAGGGGVFVAYHGQHGTVGGTSAASPLCAGIWALVDQGKGGSGITDALTKIYSVGTSGAFNDITSGNNGGPGGSGVGYAGAAGYDLATGWGSPNVANLITNLP